MWGLAAQTFLEVILECLCSELRPLGSVSVRPEPHYRKVYIFPRTAGEYDRGRLLRTTPPGITIVVYSRGTIAASTEAPHGPERLHLPQLRLV